MAKTNEIFNFKILIIGESSVGKSSLMTRFVDDTFQPIFIPTIGVDFKVRTLIIDNYHCKVQIWDTAGQERFRVITTTYYRDASGVLIVYDVTNDESFSLIRRWIDEINKYCNDNIVKILVGNKNDIQSEKVVSTFEAQQYADKMNIKFFQTSAKDSQNVNEVFYTITRLALEKRLEERSKIQNISNNDITNGYSTSQTIRLRSSRKLKRKDKKHTNKCCK